MATKYYGTKEIAETLSISRSGALNILHMLEQRGKVFRCGKLIRVDADAFHAWVEAETKKNWARIERENARTKAMIAAWQEKRNPPATGG